MSRVAKGGLLCAYRWDGEERLSNDKFACVKARNSTVGGAGKLTTD